MADWNVIRQEYEQGASLRQLAARHDVPKTTLIRRRDAERWTKDRTIGPRTRPDHTPLSKPVHLPIPDDAVSIARIGLSQLAQHLQQDTILDLKDHKLLSDALSQYVKALITAPRENEVQDGLVLPLEKLLPSTRLEIRRLLAEDEQVQQERRTG